MDGSTPGASTVSPGTPAPITLITIDHQTCRAWQYSAVQGALDGLAFLAMAGKAAVSPGYRGREGNPAQYFFGRTPSANVIGMFDRIAEYVTQSTTGDQIYAPIRVSCADKGVDKCGSSLDSKKSGFVVEHDNIVLCPIFFLFPPHTTHPPCEGELSEDGVIGLGATTRAELLMRYVAEAVGFPMINQYASGLRDNRALLIAGRRDARAEWNADSYAQTAGWAYSLGMTSHPDAHDDCMGRFEPQVFRPGTGEFPRNMDWLYLAFSKPPPLAPDRADTPRAVAALQQKLEERQRWLQQEWARRREQWDS